MPENITINLSESENAKSFENGQIIHLRELERAKEYIKNLINLSKRNDVDDYSHRTITILGSRGSGKTSFLLNLEKSFDETDVKVLPIIDPTLIEEKGHAFLNVVSAISDSVNEYFDKNRLHSNNNDDTKRLWNDKLVKLAGGIPSIDGIGDHNSDQWMDPEFVLESGLANVSAARNLKLYFNEFLKESAKILQTQVFLLRFDDIDVDSSKGWAVLECIRKYFTSPKLIILLSGDLNMYSTVVRQKKWLNFGKEILKYESTTVRNGFNEFDGSNKFRDLVVDLASQYMLKIMPPQYRIHLTTISEKQRITSKLNIFIQRSELHEEEAIEISYNNIISKFGIVNPTQQEVFRTFLLSLPLRSQIQFLTNTMVQDKLADDLVFKENINDEVLDIFMSELEEKNVDTYIIKYSAKFINSIILQLLISTKRLNDVYQLQPVTTDYSLNASLFSLNTVLSASINTLDRGKFLIFDYFLKIAYPRNLLHIIPYEQIIDIRESKIQPSIENLCKNSGMFTDRVLRDVAGEMQSYIFGAINSGNGQYTNYFIKLSGLQQKAKRNYSDRLDTVFSAQNDSSLVQKTLGYIPGYISAHSGQKTQLSYSVYLLFATIGELLKRDELIVGGQNRTEREIELKSALLNLSQLRVYNVFDFDTSGQNDQSVRGTESNYESLDDDFDYRGGSDWDQFANLLLDWFSSQQVMRQNPIPTHILGKIFTRFFYALQNIDRNYTKDILLGELFNYQIIAFLNAVIIEDSLEQLRNRHQLNMDNTNLSNRIFVNNLKKLNSERIDTSSLTLSRWLISCPLFLCYLDTNDDDLINAINKFIGKNIEERVNFSVFNLLNKVEILNSTSKNEADLGYPILLEGDPSFLRTGREKELISLLKSTYPKEWFEDKGLGVNRLHNEFITKYLFLIFGDDDRAAGKIRKFRKYLTENPSAWR